MQHVTANIHVCRSFICQLSGVARLRCAACPPCVPVCRCAGARVTVCHHRPAVVSRCGDSRGDTPHTATLHLHLHLHLHLTQGAATMVRSLGWLLAALASLGPGVAANQRDSEVVIQRHFKGDIYTTSKWSFIFSTLD